jgi:pyruvate formate lyase activating enzyme
METSGYGSYEVLREAARRLDVLYYDLKILNPVKHRSFTGADQGLILENLLKVYLEFPDLPITVRTPVVPNFNQDLTSAREIGLFLRRLPRVFYEALPYHSLGSQKYGYLSRSCLMDGVGLGQNELTQFNRMVNLARYSDLAAKKSPSV